MINGINKIAICPSCGKKVSAFYQGRAAFDKPSLLWRNLTGRIWVCNNCPEELTPTTKSWNILGGLIIIGFIVSFLIIAIAGRIDIPMSYSLSEFILGAIFIVPCLISWYIWRRYFLEFKRISE